MKAVESYQHSVVTVMGITSYLDVPLVLQEDDFSCVPACIMMVLEFVRSNNVGGYVPNMDLKQVSRAP